MKTYCLAAFDHNRKSDGQIFFEYCSWRLNKKIRLSHKNTNLTLTKDNSKTSYSHGKEIDFKKRNLLEQKK